MRKVCERRRSSEIGIADEVNDLGAMAKAVAPELLLGVVLMLWIEKQSQEIARVY